MNGLLNRDVDLAELDATIRRHWKHHLIAVTGHHGVGKTALMRHWAQRTGIRAFYFEVQPGNAEAQKSDFLLSWKRAGFTGLESEEPGSDNFWGNVFRQMTVSARNQPGIFIIDNFDFLLAADPYVAGKLQEPADHWFPDSQLILCLIGSNIRVMKQLADYQAPLYGRFDLILEVDPLPFSALRWLYPERSFTERLRIYGVAGGFPGCLHSLDGTNNTIENFPEWNLLEQGQGIVESLAAMDEYYVPILCSIVKGADTLRKLTKRQGGFGKSDLH